MSLIACPSEDVFERCAQKEKTTLLFGATCREELSRSVPCGDVVGPLQGNHDVHHRAQEHVLLDDVRVEAEARPVKAHVEVAVTSIERSF